MLQDSRDKLNKALLDTTNIMATLAMPLFAFLHCIFRYNAVLLYGDIYAASAVPFSILSMYSFVYLCTTIIMGAFMSIGRPNLQRTAAIARTILFLIIIYPATKISVCRVRQPSLLVATIVPRYSAILFEENHGYRDYRILQHVGARSMDYL